MTLSHTIRFIEKIALLQPTIKQVVANDIFRLNTIPDAKYAVFGWQQKQHSISVEESQATFSFIFFYVDRLVEDSSNELEIQSVGVSVLDNILRTLDAYGAHPTGTGIYTTFNQRFVDECAGVYVDVSLQVPISDTCEEGYFDFNDDFNEDFATTGLAFPEEGFGPISPDGGIVVPMHGGGGGNIGNIPVLDVTLDGVSVVENKVAKLPAYPKTLAELLEDEDHRAVTEEQMSEWNGKSNFSGSYEDLSDKPSIPDKTSDLSNDSGFVTGAEMSQTYETKADATDKMSTLQTEISGKQNIISDLQSIREGAAAGETAYQKPSTGIPASDLASGVIPDVSSFITKDVADLTNYYKKEETYNQGEINTALSTKQNTIDAQHKLDYSLIDNTPTIPSAPVNADWNAISGLAEILNKPNIPTQYAGSPTAGGFANKAVAIPFGEVDGDSTATNIKATVDNFPDTLADGVCAYIRNNVVASASGWKLDINGTGALPVYSSNADATRTTTIFSASVTYLFIYNSSRIEGGCWDMYYGYNTNDNTIGYNLRTNKMSLPTTSACYRYRLLFTSADGTHFVPANASSSTNATAARTTTQTPIDPFGSIRYYSYTTAVTSGNRPGVTYLWEQYELTLGYSFNRTGAALVLTQWKPIYIKCAPQSDGSAIIDADSPFVQDLPTTADGKIYISLGVATSATQVEMVFHHPVYYIDANGRKRIWTGEEIII